MLRSFFIFSALCVFSAVKSAIYLVDQIQIPGHENQCYDKDGQVFYNKGDVMKNERGDCSETRCLGLSQETGMIRVETLTCPAVVAGPGCTLVQDPTKPYPDCCPQIVAMPSIQPKYCQMNNVEKE